VIRALLLGAAALAAAAQQITVPPSAPYVRVHGEATISRVPDRVQLDVGVISQGATSQASADLNARQSKAVIDSLRQALSAANVRTVNFSVNPNYQYPKDGSPPTILGYTANNTVRLQLDDLKLLPAVIEAATKAGASNVNRLNFAAALADKLHVKLGRLLRIEEEQPVIVSPGRQVEFTAAPQAGASIEPGSIDIHASVSVTYEVNQ